MADLVTRLLLDKNLFDDNIVASCKQIQQFKEAGHKLAGMLGKVAGGLGLAVGGMEMFETAIHSCGSIERDFENKTQGMKIAVDNFFTSLYTGDWSLWENGILNAIKLGEDYIDTLRRLKQSLNIGDVHLSEVEKTMDDWIKYFNNPNISKKEKEKKYVNEYMLWASENLRYPKNLTDKSELKFLLLLKGKNVSTKGLSTEKLREIVFNYNDDAGRLHSMLEKYSSARKILKTRLGYYEIDPQKYKKALDISNKEVAQLEKSFSGIKTAYEIQVKVNGEDFENLLDLTDKLIGIEDRGLKVGYDADEINSLFTNGKWNGTGDKANSITKTKVVTSQVVKQDEEPLVIDTTPTFIPIKLDYQKTLPELEAERKSIIDRLNNSQTPDEYVSIKAELDAKDAYIEDFKSGRGLKAPKLNPIKVNSIVDGGKIKETSEYAESLNLVASAMGSISQMTNEGASAWLTWGANIMTSVATAIPAIETMIALKKQEAVANGAAEAAKTPFVGWLTVGAAVAAVAAAMFSIPKFATGGIVGGTSYSGDKIIAGVNSGEMILNGALQRNLFNLINGGSDTSSRQVEFKIKGNELVGVLNNYNKKMSRV